MPRGRKPKTEVTLEERYNQVCARIVEMETTIKSLKQQKKIMEMEIEQKRLSELDQMIKNSGKSYDDVKKFLSGKK